MNDKLILDACCGSRMFWFDKAEPHTTYIDNSGLIELDLVKKGILQEIWLVEDEDSE